MNNGERATGTPDHHYDLISVLYHALRGGEASQQYIDDLCQPATVKLAWFRSV
jgi:hypothetical protein